MHVQPVPGYLFTQNAPRITCVAWRLQQLGAAYFNVEHAPETCLQLTCNGRAKSVKIQNGTAPGAEVRVGFMLFLSSTCPKNLPQGAGLDEASCAQANEELEARGLSQRKLRGLLWAPARSLKVERTQVLRANCVLVGTLAQLFRLVTGPASHMMLFHVAWLQPYRKVQVPCQVETSWPRWLKAVMPRRDASSLVWAQATCPWMLLNCMKPQAARNKHGAPQSSEPLQTSIFGCCEPGAVASYSWLGG